MDALTASMIDTIQRYNDAVIDLGKECKSASFHPDHADSYCSALENFIHQHELLVSEFGKLTCSFDAMTEDVRELTKAIRAHAVVPDAVVADDVVPETVVPDAVQTTEKHYMATSPTSPLHAVAPEVAVDHNMDAPDETVDPGSTSPVDCGPKKDYLN